ncbi:putative short-chain dehydrogenase [Viridothelium virens]|uniref:Putative short-chain dehydrogenase n=1 Tax=Viridothelium virens TaxID=1048519 RepID=A0A6A6GZ94_VIRVR|nr:putative short-chain dehydrogenase [Viridothelium virens]
MSHVRGLFDFTKSNFTNTIHQEVYPAIAPTRPELSQDGRAILISGGGNGLGYNIAQAFVRAAAHTVVIIGRRFDVLVEARSRLEAETKAADTNTQIIARACDLTDRAQVDALWKELNDVLGIVVDVFIANAAKPAQPKRILEAGTDDIWSQLEVNAKAPLYLTEKFCSQPGKRQKFIVNVSSGSIHYYTHPGTAARPGATLSKMTGTLLFQLIAMETPHEELQVISYHPGLLWNEYFESLGLPREKFNNSELAAAFAVWAASKEAAFLHGRFAWASWDVEELATGETREQIDEDPYFLRSTIAPLKRGNRA